MNQTTGARAEGSERLGIVGQFVTHVGGDDRLFATVANDLSMKIMSAREMLEQQRRLSLWKASGRPIAAWR